MQMHTVTAQRPHSILETLGWVFAARHYAKTATKADYLDHAASLLRQALEAPQQASLLILEAHTAVTLASQER